MPRVAQRSLRRPMRSPRMPKNGEKREPTHAGAAKATRYWTEPVAVSKYQPRISASISNASDVARSAGHWQRKLATRNGARAGLRGAPLLNGYRVAATICGHRFSWNAFGRTPALNMDSGMAVRHSKP